MRTREWLKSNLENGDILRGEVLAELLDSYFHKTDTGNVERGDTQLVTGGSVYAALQSMHDSIISEIQTIIRRELENMLPLMLANYLTVEQHDEQKNALIEQERRWVLTKIADLAKNEDVEERFRLNDDKWDRKVTTKLEPYALAERVPSLVDLSAYAKTEDMAKDYAKKTELPDLSAYTLKVDFNEVHQNLKDAIDLRAKSVDVPTQNDWTTFKDQLLTALDTKADKQYVDTAKNEAITSAAQNTSSVCALRTDFGSDGIYLRTVNTP